MSGIASILKIHRWYDTPSQSLDDVSRIRKVMKHYHLFRIYLCLFWIQIFKDFVSDACSLLAYADYNEW